MEILVSQFGDAAKKVALVGKLDIDGAAAIESRLADLARSKGNIVIDMSKVAFIASIGLRHLVMTAKAVTRNAGKMLLLDPNPLVTEVLQVSGLQGILPIVRSEQEALAALRD
jgi:anti-anti-sigma factor